MCEPINAPGSRVEEQVGPDQTLGPTRVSLFARYAAPAESERAWGTLRKVVELPRVRGSLNLRRRLSICVVSKSFNPLAAQAEYA